MEVQLGVIRRRRIQLRLPRIVHQGGDGEGQGLLQLRRNGCADRGSARSQYLLKDESGAVYHTYSAYARGDERGLGAYMFIDLTPKGREENGPNYNLMDWVKRHDEYDKAMA